MRLILASASRAALAGVLALTIAIAGARGTAAQAPTQVPDVTPSAVPIDATALNADEQGMLELINDYRQSLGLRTLRVSAALQEAARWKVEALAATGEAKLSHDDVERTWRERLLDFGYPEDAIVGENLGTFQGASIEALLEAWQASPPHLANLRAEEWQTIGVAMFVADDGTEYWVTDFGADAR